MRFIGDVHGKEYYYRALTQEADADHEETFQIGDLGLGFGSTFQWLHPSHRFIRGNHDDPAACRKHPNYLGDFGYLPDRGLFYAGGGFSIDRAARIEGISWWADEELNYTQMAEACEVYSGSKPRVVATHEGPVAAVLAMFPTLLAPWDSQYGPYEERASRTASWLQYLFEEHQPEVWVFGHWHETKKVELGGTIFLCLGELETADVELSGGRSNA